MNPFSRRDFVKFAGALFPSMGLFAAEATAEQEPQAVKAKETLPELSAEETLISTGFPVLDECLKGGFRPGSLAVIMGRANIGKSLVCHHIAEHHGVPADNIECDFQGTEDVLSLKRDENGVVTGHLDIDCDLFDSMFTSKDERLARTHRRMHEMQKLSRLAYKRNSVFIVSLRVADRKPSEFADGYIHQLPYSCLYPADVAFVLESTPVKVNAEIMLTCITAKIIKNRYNMTGQKLPIATFNHKTQSLSPHSI